MIDTKALREKILDLAIRGKLVPQDPNDEPASVLLERIRAQKQQMVKEGKLKAKDIKNDTIIFKGEDNLHYEQFRDGTVKCIEDEIPFELPEGWAWCRFSSGFIINPRNSIQDNIEVSFIPMPLIQEGYTNNHKSEIRLWKKVKTGYTHFAENDIAIAKITPCFENKKSVVFRNLSNGYGAGTTELHIIRTIEDTVLPEYVLWYIKRDDFISDGISAFSGAVGQKRIGREFIEQYLIPLPPVSEQERILEAIHTSFISINNIECSDTELNALITIAKSKILDLAIRGKLVPQDPNDEPASVLLKRIRAEKEELIRQGKIKRDKKESVIFKGEDNSYYEKIGNQVTCIDSEIPFEIPENWAWSRLQGICEPITDGTHQTPVYSDSGYIFLSAKNVTTGSIDWNNIIHIPESLHKELYSRIAPKKGDILLAKNGTIGVAAIVDRDCEFDIYVTLALLRTVNQLVSPQYLLRAIGSATVQSFFEDTLIGIGVPNLHLVHIRQTLIPIPPLAEQERLANEVKKIFDILSNIKQSVS